MKAHINHREHKENKYFTHSVKSMETLPQREFPLKDITEKTISCAIEVHSTLGPGLLESAYEEALAHEFKIRRIKQRV